MPKIIENLRERVLAAARETLSTDGYRGLSMRALARSCGVAPGTLYNYFQDKDQIVATLALADWQDVLTRMAEDAESAMDLVEGLGALCDEACSFAATYRPTWEQYEYGRAATYLAGHHRMLREQIARPVASVLARTGRADLAGLADVLAEALLACAVNDDLGTPEFGKLVSALGAGARDASVGAGDPSLPAPTDR